MPLPQDISAFNQNLVDTVFATSQMDWIETTPGQAWMKILWTGSETGTWAVILKWAKGYAAPIFQGVAARALQLMGPEAWSKDHLMEKWYRDVKFFDIVEGTRNLHRIAFGRQQFGSAVSG